MKRTLLSVILVFAISSSIFAISWNPSFGGGGGVTFSQNRNLPDEEIPARTSFNYFFNAELLSARTSYGLGFGLGNTLLFNTKSLTYGNIELQGFMGIGTNLFCSYAFNRIFLLKGDIHFYCNTYRRQDYGFLSIGTTITPSFLLGKYVSVNLPLTFEYRSEVLDYHIAFTLSIYPWKGEKK